MREKIKLIKSIYLYLVSFVALMMVVISMVNLLNMLLKTYVFTQADGSYSYVKPVGCDSSARLIDDSAKQLTEAECEKLKKEQEKQAQENLIARRHSEFARDISLIVVGIPLFAAHWWVIRKKEV